VYNERDTGKLRKVFNFVESKFRSLEALEVEQAIYATFIVPSLLEKLPDSLRITMTRGERPEEWNMEKFLEGLGGELDLREEYRQRPQRDERQRKPSDRQWSTMFAGSDSNCAFCSYPGYRPEDCKKITDIKERKNLLLQFGRCYNCLRKGHLARECKISFNCSACKGEHHKALCGVEREGNSPAEDGSKLHQLPCYN
jgi:hypothetical protein